MEGKQMKKYLTLILTAIPVVLLACLTLYLAIVRSQLPEVTVRIAGYDPRDLLSGHYIAYTIDWQQTDCKQFEGAVCPEQEFYRAAANGSWGRQYRFYIPEQYAGVLDHTFRQSSTNGDIFEVVYGYAPGFTPRAKKLLINGREWQQYLK